MLHTGTTNVKSGTSFAEAFSYVAPVYIELELESLRSQMLHLKGTPAWSSSELTTHFKSRAAVLSTAIIAATCLVKNAMNLYARYR